MNTVTQPDPARARRRFLAGLGLSAAGFGVVSALVWGYGHGAWPAVALSFVAPPVSAVAAAVRGDFERAFLCGCLSLLTGWCIARGLSRPGLLRTLLAHAALAQYWLWAFALAGIGV